MTSDRGNDFKSNENRITSCVNAAAGNAEGILQLIDDSSAAIYVCDAESYKLLFVNEKAAKMCGKPVSEAQGKTCYEYLKGREHRCEPCYMDFSNDEEYTERTYTSPSSGRHYMTRGKLIRFNGRRALVEFLVDETKRITAERMLENLINGLPGGIGIFHVYPDGKLENVYLNDGYHTLLNDTRTSREGYAGMHALDAVHPEDRAKITQELLSSIRENRTASAEVRIRTGDGTYKWISVRANIGERSNEKVTIYTFYSDIDELKKTQLRLEESNRLAMEANLELEKSRALQMRLRQRLDDVINTVPCGICLYSWDGKELLPIIANRQLSEMLGEDALAHLQAVKGMSYTHIHPEELDRVSKASMAALTDSHQIDQSYRMLNQTTGQYSWVRMRGASTLQEDGTWLVYVSYFDVTQEHETEKKLRESENLLEHATEHAGLWYWKYDMDNDRAYLDARHQREFGLPEVVDDFLESWLQMGFIHPDDADLYRDAYRRIENGEKQVVFEVRVYLRDKALHWGRLCLTSLSGEPDLSNMVVCTAMIIDNEKELYAKYELEKRKPSHSEKTLLVHALFNLTTGATLEYLYQDGTTVPLEGRTAFTGDTDYLDTLLIDEEERRRYRAINDKAFLMAAYEKGETELSIDYRRLMPDGDVVWVRNNLHMLRDPKSSDILLFEYCYNVEEEKMRSLMYHSLATDNYDYVARINANSKHYSVIHKVGGRNSAMPLHGENADAVSILLAQHVHPEDREELLEHILIEGIKRNLEKQERFVFTCRFIDDDGTVLYKKITEYYIDRQRELIVMTREDVTPLIRTEMEKNEMLANALDAAKQASRAKSQFLSRMSHELRTPMNAIIGLSALAANDISNPAAMEDTIGKIGLSARYLLSLINDILEMSRIESGHMTLNAGPFDFEQLISSVNNIIFRQASEKGLDYDSIVNSFMEPIYIGDETKLQQVLVNVLGNAVKFTPPGGKVTLTMEQVRRAGDHATLRFAVSDTGIGIDENFMPHLFDAFSQEYSSYTSTSTGTGLGLAISKSMVEMMNGQIRVQSVKNVGSVFTIEVQLGISEESRKQMELLASMNLSNMKALVVDDDVLVCKSTEHILSTMGMRAEWVDSGCRAIERVQRCHAEKSDYDTVFIDWKMPDMDGIETTREIRKIVGPDVTIIIMTAYDWKQIELEARDAGVDLFMEKPLFQSSIVNAFEKIFHEHKDKLEAKPQTSYRFAGKRFLLAEDHPLNVEVAKRILERVEAEVVVAANGLEALETFATSEDGYFDAILMDVRMPIMDGLTATKNIRNLKKMGSRTIPIIAMTANAFDEDADLSMASGMDAHLIKPIDPQLLYSTLHKLISR